MIHRFFSRAVFALSACSAALFAASVARAADFSAEYVFGDSLSDNGNLASIGPSIGLTFNDPPSYNNSFTNGPVAVQLLAESLGLSANASLWLTSPSPQGTNYAVGGATAATPSPVGINLLNQVDAYSAFESGHADPNALYVVMIGGNDVRNAALGAGASAVTAGVQDELAAITTLSGEGAEHFLVVNVPNVGLIPEFTQADPANPTQVADATMFSQMYDTDLAAGLTGLDLSAGTTLTDFDLYDLNANILANAAAHGFTNTTDPCYSNTPGSAASSTGCTTANIDSFVYWDDIHPTAPVQALWAKGFESAVPEPSTWAMLVVGFSGLAFGVYRRGALRRAAT
jgi:phospholipase/lecithinase/hemolysin